MRHSFFQVLIIGVLFSSLSVLAQEENQINEPIAGPCDSEGFEQFRFWVGDWNVYDTLGNQVGTNNVQLILKGCV